MLDAFNFTEQAKKLEKPGEFVRKRVVTGDRFDIDLYVYADGGGNRYHICSEDEYFYVIKGDVEMIVENDKYNLKEGEGLMIKAGLKHIHSSEEKLYMIVISKWPHKHIYFD